MKINKEMAISNSIDKEADETGCKMDACSECARNCTVVHQLKKKHGSAVITSFFKVMFCNKYSELMFLPPKFAATVSKLVNRKIVLEDSHGRRWPVRISEVDGSLAFTHGWNAFFLDHGLTLGDFIFFFYLRSHFVVKIYDKSGCEKLDFPKASTSKKRTRVEPYNSKRRHTMNDKSSRNSSTPTLVSVEEVVLPKESPTPRSKRTYDEKANGSMEEWLFLSDPVARDSGNDDHRPLFDLSDFEKNCNNLCANGSKRKAIEIADLSRKPEVGGDERRDEMLVSNQPNTGIFELNAAEDGVQTLAREESGSLYSGLASQNEQLSKPQSPEPTATVGAKREEQHMGIEEREDARKTYACATFSATGPCKIEPREERLELYTRQTSRGLKFPKAETMEICANPRSRQEIIPGTYGDLLPPLKVEPEAGSLDMVPISPLQDSNGIGIAKYSSHLELTLKLAPAGRFRKGRKVVILRDQQSRLWPALYYERPDLKVLMGGWKSFCKANEIQPGDKCIFKLENRSDCIYAVSTIREPRLLLPAP